VGISTSPASDRFNSEYWAKTPHLFVHASWNKKYCELCRQGRAREIHLKHTVEPSSDPRFLAKPRKRHILTHPEGTWYVIEAWSDNNEARSYTGYRDFDEAVALAREWKRNGDEDGKRYDHYAIAERSYYMVCDTNVHNVDDLL
jgi:hypothetical protein